MSLSDFEVYAEKMFEKYDSNFFDIKNKLDKQNYNNIEKFLHFYYHICSFDQKDWREEFKLIGIVSLIEALMSLDTPYTDIFQYLNSHKNTKKENNILTVQNFSQVKDEYYQLHGCVRKVKEYFSFYFDKNEIENFYKSIEKFDEKNNVWTTFNNLEQFCIFIYEMRSDFVHKAHMVSFCPIEAISLTQKIGGKYYVNEGHFDEFLHIFEKSFVKFWEKKISEASNV